MTFISAVSYRDKRWYEKRDRIISRDNHTCVRCGCRKSDDQLQVHHLHYFENRKPWEYEDFELITLCKGCHAQEHGHIRPNFGWKYEGMEDLEDLSGECELCHQPIRYEHLISHPDWGFMTVGAKCAENLTSEYGLSEQEERAKKLAQRYRRYMVSPKWEHRKNGYFIKFDECHIKIWDHGIYCNLQIGVPLWNLKTLIRRIELLSSDKKYQSIEDAKTQAFKAITDRSLIGYCEKHYPQDTPFRPVFNEDNYCDYD